MSRTSPMSRTISVALIVVAGMAGCSKADPASRNETDPMDSQTPASSDQSAPSKKSFSHVVSRETEYYTTGPQQGRPPDGTFPEGAKVEILEQSGSYTLVRSEDGIEAYVAADVLNETGKGRVHTPANVTELVDGMNDFAWELYQQLKSGQGNLFFSPAGISTALAMTYGGAAGSTESEMAATLHFSVPQARVHQGMQALQSVWRTAGKKQGYRLHLANRLWGQAGYHFLPEFLQITRNQYGAELAQLDFAVITEESRQTINRWVADQTEGKISELIPPGMLPSDSKLVLTNAVYFKGSWTEPFDEERTQEEDFYLTGEKTVRAWLMNRQDDFRYAAVEGLQFLELPYGDRSLSLLVLLPEQVDGLNALEPKLTPENLKQWTAGLQSREVKVYLPRFTMTSEFELSGTLTSMGMTTAFDRSLADFSRMTGGRDLFITAALHKAFVDVNEEGTEAAAATGAVMAPTAAPVEPPQPPVFRADHPFVFLIRDHRSGAILFLGRLADPT